MHQCTCLGATSTFVYARICFFFPYGDAEGLVLYACVYIRDCSYRFRVCSVCVSLESVCVCLRGLTGGLGLNLNAGHCAACRFRFCLSALFCAQDGNPSNMARIRIKSNSPPSLSLRSKTVSFEGTDGASGGLGRWSCKVPVPILWCVSEGLDWDCFVHSHRDKTDKGTGIIGLMLECVCGHQLLI